MTLVVALGALTATMPGAAQPQQNGLVNINVSDNTVLVPISIAANVCGVTVAILVDRFRSADETTCDALATSSATAERGNGGGADARQNGLINVNLDNNFVAIPIAAAANICDVDVVVLVRRILLNDATSCKAKAGAEGIVPPLPAG